MKHGSEPGQKNAYQRLVEDLKSGELTLTLIDIAVMEWIQTNNNIPEGARDLLATNTDGAGQGIIRILFLTMKQTIGAMELSYRRGVQEGIENKKPVK